MYTSTDTRTIWQRRAARARFLVWGGRTVADMSDADIEAAFDGLAAEYGISYIWAY